MKNKLLFPALLVFILMFCFVFLSCNNPSGGNITHTVMFLITGPQTTAYRVMYSNETDNYDQITDVPIPWEKTITVQGRKNISCSAIFLSNTSTYTAKIFVDGQEKYSSSSSSGSVAVSGVTQ